jgi:hypothetical protein
LKLLCRCELLLLLGALSLLLRQRLAELAGLVCDLRGVLG